MVDYLTEIPLPGRRLAPPRGDAALQTPDIVSPTFVAGPENRLVASTFRQLLATANSAPDGNERFAPSVLSLFGPSGAGKTHLAHGLVRYWQQQRGEEAAEYVTAADLRHHFFDAIRRNAVGPFRHDIRQRQLLAIDDLHHLPFDAHLLQDLRYMLDDYQERGGIVVITSNRPANMLALTPDLCSRLAAGLMLQLAAPGTAARLQVIQRTSAAIGRTVSDDVAQRLAAGLAGSATDLIGVLFDLFQTAPDDCAGVDHITEKLQARRRPTLREIVAVVARYMETPQKQLRSGSRKQSTVFARSVAVYLARELTGASYHEIGRALGGRDHTTIMHNYRKIDRDRLCNVTTQESIDELRRILLSY